MIGNCQIKNRFVVPAMDTALPDENGFVTDRAVAYYEARAKGGFGLIITEYCHVSYPGKPHTHSISIFDDKYIPGLARIADAVHKYDGAKVFAQLHHVGRQGNLNVTNIDAMEAPSAVPDILVSTKTRALSTEEVYDLVEKFGDAAVRAQKAGFDGVEIHGGHGYLVSEFMSGVCNRRTDEFGGDFRGRMLFPELILKNIRKKVGNNFPVTIRISSIEPVPGGREIEETRAVAKYLEKVGYQGINVSIAMNGAQKWVIVPNQVPSGYNIGYAEQIKKSVSIPVIGGGRINDAYMAEGFLEDGRADMVFFGRGSLADPALPNKVAAGALDEITPCIGCVQRCQLHVLEPMPKNVDCASCMMNPFSGRESLWIKRPTETPKNIAVVGAGPAGMAFAYNAAERGHKVTIFEKSDVVGGQFRIASMPPYKHELARAIKYLHTMCKKYKVDIRFNTEATADMLLEGGFDAVVLATGGQTIIPPIKGVDGPIVRTATEVLTSGQPPRGKIMIIGAGETGTETADYLGHRTGNRVTVVEMGKTICPGKFFTARSMLLERIKDYGTVTFMTKTKVKEFTDDGAIVEKDGEEIVLSGFHSIVLAMGTKSYNPLEESLQGKIELHTLGDAVKPASALEAIETATKLAIEI